MSARPATYNAADQGRRAAIAKVQIARKELRLDDPTYRALLERITGKTSSADCTVEQLGLVLDEFKAKGWKPVLKAGSSPGQTGVSPKKPQPADHPVAKKARAMWISLWQLGVVRERSEQALEAFAARQLHVDRLQWADQAQGYKLVEALKAMAERAGWSQDLAGVPADVQVRLLKERLLAAQQALIPHIGREIRFYTDAELDEAIRANGVHVREVAHA